MTVRIRGLGPFRDIIGEKVQSITLSSGYRLKDCMWAVHERWADSLPPHLWDHENRKAMHAVVLIVEGKRVTDLNTLLRENQEVLITKVSVGG